MNIGAGGGAVKESGELFVIKEIATYFKSQSDFKHIVFDVGANHGEWTSAFLKTGVNDLEIHCFEPGHATFAILSKTLHDAKNVRLHDRGCSDQNKEMILYSDQPGSGMASLYDRSDRWQAQKVESETVKLVRLDEFCSTQHIDKISFLKMDIEGHEFQCLQGAERMIREQRIEAMQFEFGGCQIQSRTYFKDFWDLLSPQYNLFRILPQALYPVHSYSEECEVFLLSNFVALRKEHPLSMKWVG
jgi:FkbM family methyltransferase